MLCVKTCEVAEFAILSLLSLLSQILPRHNQKALLTFYFVNLSTSKMPKAATCKTTRKPNPPCTVTTRAANATAHPGLIASTAHKPADPSVKTAKANKAEAKEHKGACLAKFQEDTMDREEMLEATPCPDITPARCRTHVPSSGLSAAGSVVKSEVDTDDMNPDKATYQPGSTTEDDSISELSVVPTSPIKPTYAQVVASPTPKKKIPQPAATA